MSAVVFVATLVVLVVMVPSMGSRAWHAVVGPRRAQCPLCGRGCNHGGVS